ncbi:MAG: DUF2314 domain-containing protein [Phycisphaeraceae bacterium]|nr:DUF2314 domain-containing protein [Phycisphaeraceae bacterium]MCW5763668.1 DUF2314 domain-containing protein [Phycisphaeraceae bacterium]
MIGSILRTLTRLFRPRARRSDLNFSVVILMKELPNLTDAEIVSAVRRALPTSAPTLLEASALPAPDFAPNLEDPGRMIPVAVNRCVYGILIARFAYDPDPESNTTPTSRPDFDAAYRAHKAWIAIDHLGGDTDQAFAVIGQIAAEIAPSTATLLFLPGLNLAAIPTPEILEAMRTGPWLDLMSNVAQPSVIHRPQDDAALADAAREAHSRFPEFAEAFALKKGINHSAKFPFDDGQAVEHMWIDVHAITDTTISGTLGNEPHEVKGFALGDQVTRPIDQLEDWLYIHNNDIVGGFSVQILIDEHES